MAAHTKDLPERAEDGHGYIYVIGFSNGTVKVGSTARPRMRFTQHRGDATKFGLRVDEWWISEALPDYRDRELDLIANANEMDNEGRLGRDREYLQGVPFHAVAELAQDIATDSGVFGEDDEVPAETVEERKCRIREEVATWPALTETQRRTVAAAFRSPLPPPTRPPAQAA